MRLVRCDACGAKAILAASQCPKCAEPLYVRNERGDEVRLVGCRSCATYYPASRDGCRWCPAVTRSAMPEWTGKAIAAALITAVSVGGWQFIPGSSPPSPATAPNAMTPQSTPVPRLASVAVIPVSASQSLQRVKIVPGTAGTRAPEVTKPAPSAAATNLTSVASSVNEEARTVRTAGSPELVSAKATTWVNVRADASGQSEIVGIIQPDSIVELGESRRGWRRVSTRWFSGWASAKLFRVDSVP